ncbi:MAG: hypothetical protein M3237_06065 [Actinomycetota bacterium]|nr:hypothetical protein [Actinomycetota bacterium]
MKWTGPAEADYDEQRELFNAMIDKKPRLIAACATPVTYGPHSGAPGTTPRRL